MYFDRSVIIWLIGCLFPQLALSKGQVRTLEENSWRLMLKGEWMVEFFAPWCPACQQLHPVWKEFAEWSEDLSIKVGSVDVTTNPGLSGRFVITALPTIFHVKNGEFRQYMGSRDKDSFISFIEDKRWERIVPVSSWKSPQSFQMTTISYFFKLSMLLRNTHNTMVQDYGIPYWGSYLVFGVATIVIGAILGLLVVCVIDFFCPSRVYPYDPMPPINNKENEGEVEYEGEDVIRDDTAEDVDLRRRIRDSEND